MLEERSDEDWWTCDKLAMKEFARKNTNAARVPTTYWTGVDLKEIDGARLPPKWVMKPNHRSQVVFFGEGQPDSAVLKEITKGWLKTYERAYLGEWAYRMARRCLIVEEHLGAGKVINDYKIYVFGGTPRLIQVDSDRFSVHKRRFYTTDWEPLEFRNGFPIAPTHPVPKLLDTMLTAASELGRTFGFMRVDLYEANDAVYFGEVTPYPEGGMKPFWPDAVDRDLGYFWRQAQAITRC
jgi:hypothetical protein